MSEINSSERRLDSGEGREEPPPRRRVHIRWMIRRDMPEVLAIEKASFAQPWGEEDFLKCLRQRNIGMVVEVGDQVVGFMLYELHSKQLRIFNFAVHPDFRRLKVGTQMVEKLTTKLSTHRRTSISLEVRETNLAAQLFYKSCGFRATMVERDFYEDTGEAAFVMEYWLADHWPEEVWEWHPRNRISQYLGKL